MTKRIISVFLAFAMVLSILLSAVSCNELFDELLVDPNENEAQSNIEDDIEETTKEEKTTKKEKPTKTAATEEEVTEEYTEVETTYVYETTYSGETAPVERPIRPATTEVETEDETEYPTWVEETTESYPNETTFVYECGHCDCIVLGGCHYCELCGEQIKPCADYDFDHICDVCGMITSACINEDNDAYCDMCGIYVGYNGIVSSGFGEMSADIYYENGEAEIVGLAGEWISEYRANGVSGVNSVGFHGWVFANNSYPISRFGYAINDGDIIWSGEVVDAPDLDQIFAPLAPKRYNITVDFSDLPDGEYDVTLYVRFVMNYVFVLDMWPTLTVRVENDYCVDEPDVEENNDIVYSMDANEIASTKNHANIFGSTFGTDVSLSKDGTYATLTMDYDAISSYDYGWYPVFPGVKDIKSSPYMVMKYRTTVDVTDYENGMHKLFLQTENIQLGDLTIDLTLDIVPDGEWHYLYIDLTERGVGEKDAAFIEIMKFDFFKNAPDGSTIDIEFINFYTTSDVARLAAAVIYRNPSDYASVSISGEYQICSLENVGLAPIYNAIEVVNFGHKMNEEYIAVANSDLIWLANPDDPLFLSRYSKIVITFTCDAGEGTQEAYNQRDDNYFEVLCYNEVLGQGEYTLPESSWKWNTCEIDISYVNYNGEILIRLQNGGLQGIWYVIESIVLLP